MSQAARFGSLLVGLGCGGVLGLYLAQNYNDLMVFCSIAMKVEALVGGDIEQVLPSVLAPLYSAYHQTILLMKLPDLHTLSEKLFVKTNEYKKDDKK